jgi:hypothetical protein
MNKDMVTWRGKVIKPIPSGVMVLNFSYRPYQLHVQSEFTGSVKSYSLEDGRVSYSPFKNYKRTETWSFAKQKRSQLGSLFMRKGAVQNQERGVISAVDQGVDWIMKYVGEYMLSPMGSRDQYDFRYRLGRLELVEVSLPITQVVRLI